MPSTPVVPSQKGDAPGHTGQPSAADAPPRQPRIGILVVAYNAESTLAATLDRIPLEFRDRVEEVLVCDDASHDGTFQLAQQWGRGPDSPKTLAVRHTKNLGYGGNQKAGYALAMERGLDIVVLLHGDGQYAPERLPDLVEPLLRGECDAVFGSRMLERGAARRGGMPLYKRLGNRILTSVENRLLGSSLSEFHSGYRAYSLAALRDVPLQYNSDGFDFDTQIIVQLLAAGKRIVEMPIPTYYGDEICYVNGVGYARDVVRDIIEYRLARMGFGTPLWVTPPPDYNFKAGDASSHSALLGMLDGLPPSRILDLGCASGFLAEHARSHGHEVTGVDHVEHPGVRERTDRFIQADLAEGLPDEVGGGYDVIIAGDVIEHLPHPRRMLEQIRDALRPGGRLLLSVPNFAHWYPRLRVAFGLFGYDRRGILDETHMRFFTRRSLLRIVRSAGFDVLEEQTTGLPLGEISRVDGRGLRTVRRADRLLARLRPTLFAYQYVLRLTPHAEDVVHVEAF